MNVHRHPRCVTPPCGTPAADFTALQAAQIVALDGELASARARNVDLESDLHGARNELTVASGALQLIAMLLGLSSATPPPEIVAEAQRRLR